MKKTDPDVKKLFAFLGDHLDLSKYSADALNRLLQHLSFANFQKGDAPIRQGQYHAFAYYIQQGAARSYYLKDGIEVNTWFAFEGDIVASFRNYQGNPSMETSEFLENSHCIRIDLRAIAQEAEQSILASTFIRQAIEEYTAFLEDRMYHLQFNAGMERYNYVLQQEPELLHRIPLTYLASYLGMSRENLSRLRAKITL